MSTPLPWSHSSLIGFATCGRQYEEIKVLRNFQDQKNPQSAWGDYFHKQAEKFIGHWSTAGAVLELPEDMHPFEDYLLQFCGRPGKTLVECEYAIDRQLQPCDFLGKTVWGRGIIDVLTLDGTLALVDDHKTGKQKKDMQQLIIFALLVFYHHPEIQTVKATFYWLKFGDLIDTETFYRHQIADLWAELIPKLTKYRDAFHLGVFEANPTGLCIKHCAVDTCEYFGRGKRR